MENNAKKIAEYLLQIKAIKLQPSNPFTWASGWKSPIYCDNRKTLSFPEVRSYIRDSFASLVNSLYPGAELIAGVATGAISHGALVADKLELPFIYVRSGAKEHGLGNQIEGYYTKGQKVVVIEDLISTGGSSLNAVKALREAGCQVLGMAAIFTYEFKKASDAFAAENVPLNTLCNYSVLIETALNTGYISSADLETLKLWRVDPSTWGL
ncbi:MAG TPA: orotate phosphoribosyltransferase [Bacteroidales bacterium]|jgi:orotate phosphoribosyltransferase|nr:orotate phosphoribosyltransferase [Bacteroidales bacterium]OQB61237.1 MAG: Orotate phosphoribosyltransferase [Bacteroidetes bacterium ADurb.Bin145]HOU02230.1 orotate phosphoribosyltransferase [Bacteroidales bacterium]HQG63677.1 orotate phosphoribosyltransferase [Bacteroidales bacterium]HQK68610.1 orotate phosphoribosyltransferase [Bacteroidales bacterium]